MGNRNTRVCGAPDELAAYLASILASSPKSRLARDLLSIADYDRGLHPMKQQFAALPVQDRVGPARDRSRPYAERMVAAWLAAGTSQFAGAAIPRTSGNRRLGSGLNCTRM